MIRAIVYQLVLLGFIFSGCSNKVPEKVVVKTEYVYEEPYKFEKIDLDGVYIELGTKEIQKMCTPGLLEINSIYKGAIEYYDWQIDTYRKDRNISKGVSNE